jgi:hypothetical protein
MMTLPKSNTMSGIEKFLAVAIRLAVIIVLTCFAPVMSFATTSTYTISSANIENPERGFYLHVGKCNEKLWDKDYLLSYKNQAPDRSLVLCLFYLPNSQDDISAQVAHFANQGKAVKDAGLKMVLRFAYFEEDNGVDAPLTRVMSHIDQLQGTLMAHKDVIAVMESGFIGQWGEGHSSTYFPDNDWTSRKLVVEKLRTILKGRMVQVRKPKTKRSMYGMTPVANNVGHHNDCFLATFNDYGTYGSNMEEEQNYLALDTENVAMGGETCKYNPPRSECPVAVGTETTIGELERFHYTYLNGVGNPQVLQSWIDGKCMEKIQRSLGYRLALVSSTFPASVRRGTTLNAQIKVTNVGWSAPINSRQVYLELRNRMTGGIGAKLDLKSNVTDWKPGTTTTIAIGILVPATIPTGDYDLFLRMPDPSSALANKPEYTIKLANPGDEVFVSKAVTNQLWHVLRVDP